MPDIDSLPPPYSPSRTNGSERHHSPSPRASTASLAAAATINAGIQNEDSRRSSSNSVRGNSPFLYGQGERRRSNAFLSSYDPTLPGPGELQTGDLRLQTGDLPSPRLGLNNLTASPHGSGSPTYPPRFRDRTLSLGEIHQQLEQEQEAQVIRLLAMIRQGQAELQAIRDQAAPGSNVDHPDIGEIMPPYERSAAVSNTSRDQPTNSNPDAVLPRLSSRTNRNWSGIEPPAQPSHRSRTPSRTASPSLRNPSTGAYAQNEDFFSGSRSQSLMDENAYYQAETQNLTRENQMLRQRIRELERQINEGNSTTANSPIIPSNLSGPPIEAESTSAVLAGENEKEE